MEHILSLSYGKDSLTCLGAIEELGWPLDRIVNPFEYVVFCGDCGVMTGTSEDEMLREKNGTPAPRF